MSERPPHLQDLPPMTPEVCQLHLLQEEQHVSFVLRPRSGEDVVVFTLHVVEADKLVRRLTDVLSAGDGANSFVEGAYIGGPPRPDQLRQPE